MYGMLYLPCKEAPTMAPVRCTDGPARPTAFLDGTSVTLDEFPQLVPPFDAAFHAPSAMSPPTHSRRWRSGWGGATCMGGMGSHGRGRRPQERQCHTHGGHGPQRSTDERRPPNLPQTSGTPVNLMWCGPGVRPSKRPALFPSHGSTLSAPKSIRSLPRLSLL